MYLRVCQLHGCRAEVHLIRLKQVFLACAVLRLCVLRVRVQRVLITRQYGVKIRCGRNCGKHSCENEEIKNTPSISLLKEPVLPKITIPSSFIHPKTNYDFLFCKHKRRFFLSNTVILCLYNGNQWGLVINKHAHLQSEGCCVGSD